MRSRGGQADGRLSPPAGIIASAAESYRKHPEGESALT